MALSTEASANFARVKAEAAAKRAAAAEGAGETVGAPEELAHAELDATEDAPAKPVRAATPRATKPPEGSQAATIAALAAELALADRARDAVLTKLRAAVA